MPVEQMLRVMPKSEIVAWQAYARLEADQDFQKNLAARAEAAAVKRHATRAE